MSSKWNYGWVDGKTRILHVKMTWKINVVEECVEFWFSMKNAFCLSKSIVGDNQLATWIGESRYTHLLGILLNFGVLQYNIFY